jgi:hypothetical protein
MKEEATKDNFLLEIIMYYGVKKKKTFKSSSCHFHSLQFSRYTRYKQEFGQERNGSVKLG